MGGSVGLVAPGAGTEMNIASASKWLYGAYVLEVLQGQLRPGVDVPFLNLTSTTPVLDASASSACKSALSTVRACGKTAGIEEPLIQYVPEPPTRFYYHPGHFEAHADFAMGMGFFDGASLALAFQGRLPLSLSFVSVNLAGGAKTSASEYAKFLRALMRDELKLGPLLGTHSTCATAACGNTGYSPWFATEPAHYSLAHWVEPDEGTPWSGGFSSAGLFGFYPWIAKDKGTYLIVAGEHLLGVLGQSRTTPAEETASGKAVLCGRLIKKAYYTGVVQE
ncbi:hypothetical protein KRR26_28825 [Corallococcus sp. M34]|uniref:hypothetical protein n=1 Tax=Citreicoccus inhibens TaxID=2849499 RepID=UPI001C22EE36|nr:hypothetical protein [Citreicoccus inhibens]MBU8899621.1 hypothetical protein [Citreicoccus inhibens]